MSVIRKFFVKKDLVKVQKLFDISRALHLTAAEINDKNVIKSDADHVHIPNVTLPEVIEPKFELYKNFTAVVS